MRKSEKSNSSSNAGDEGGGASPALKVGAEAKRPDYVASRYYTISSVANLFDVSPRTVRRWIDDRQLVAHKINNVVRISARDLSDFSGRHRSI